MSYSLYNNTDKMYMYIALHLHVYVYRIQYSYRHTHIGRSKLPVLLKIHRGREILVQCIMCRIMHSRNIMYVHACTYYTCMMCATYYTVHILLLWYILYTCTIYMYMYLGLFLAIILSTAFPLCS